MKFMFENPYLPAEKRALDLLEKMSVEEKVGQMMQITFNGVSKEEAKDWVVNKGVGSFLHVIGDDARELQELTLKSRFKVPLIFGIDAIHGHGIHNGATVFPSQLAMSCSWNPDLVKEVGRVTAREVAADGLHWTFSPVLCIGRDLRWGRVNETFGEDPYLIGKLASAIIRGYQGNKLDDKDSILACAKHYIAYGESTGGRDSVDASVSERKVREVFLPPFKEAVEAGVATVMTGYLPIDGVPVSANTKILKDLLKDELGFNGFVVTDWNNVGNLVHLQKVSKDIGDAAKKTVEAGNDMIMNTPEFYNTAVDLVKKGVIPEKLIDEAVKRILFMKFSMGLFDMKRSLKKDETKNIFACPEHLEVDMKVTRESMVLLENKNNVLPFKKNVKTVAVIGPNADDIKAQFGDWTFFTHPDPKPDAIPLAPYQTMLSGIRKLSQEKGVEVLYHKGCDIADSSKEDIKGAVEIAAKSDVIVAVVGDNVEQNGEFRDRADLNLSGSQQKLLESLKKTGKPLVVVLVNCKPLTIPWIAQNADAVVETFNSGLLGGKALAEIIYGETNPSGKLSISFPHHVGQLPVYYNHLPGWHGDRYIDMPKNPLYSFGYGLSYSNFKYSNLRLSKDVCGKDDEITVKVDITNAGDRKGSETVQLYVNDVVRSVMAPVKELKGFAKEQFEPWETRTVEMSLKVADLGFVDQDMKYVVEPGEFTLMVGSDSRDEVLLKTSLTVSDSLNKLMNDKDDRNDKRDKNKNKNDYEI